MIFGLLAVAMLLTGSSANFSDQEHYLLFSLREFFHAGFVVFIEDEMIPTGLTNEVKRTSESSFPSITVTPEQLKTVLERDRVFPSRAIVTTKRVIDLGPLLKLVPSANRLVWALFSEPSDLGSIGSDIPYDGSVFLIRTEPGALRIQELLSSRNGRQMLTRSFGFVETESEIAHFPDRTSYSLLKSNLSGVDVRIGRPKDPCHRRKDGVLLEKIFCYHSEIMDIMSEKLDFRQIAVIYHGDSFSFVTSNGSYSGFFRMLLDEKVDLSVAGFVITARRLNDFRFIWPTFMLETMMYVRKMDVETFSTSTPFSSLIWTITFIWIVVIGALLFLSNRYNSKSKTRKNNNLHFLFSDIFEIVQLACNQGLAYIPSFSASRMIYSTMLFGGLLLYNYYSAVVQSYLTIEGLKVPFTNFDGFLKNGKFTIIGIADGFSIYYIKFEILHLNVMGSNLVMKAENLPTNVEDGIRKLCRKKFLTLLELKGTVLSAGKSECELIEIPSPILFQFFGLAAVKGSQFIEYLTRVLWRLNEVGIIQRMSSNLTKVSNVKALHEGSGYQPVAFEQIYDLLIILKIGMLASLFVLLLEIRKFRKTAKRSLINIHENRLHKMHLQI